MENYRIFISAPAQQVLKKFPKQTQREIEKEVFVLSENPFLGERLTGPLNFLYSYHFTISGKYFRAAYAINSKEKKVTLHYVGPRGEFYERLGRLFG